MLALLSAVKDALLKTARLAIYTNLYIALGAVAFAYANASLLGVANDLPWSLWATIFFSTFLVYQLSRWSFHRRDFDSPRVDSIYRWLDNNSGFTIWSMAVSAVALAFCVQYVSTDALLLLAVMGGISVAYPLEWKWRGKRLRIRDIPFIKIFLIALVWSGMAVMLPAVESVGWKYVQVGDLYLFGLQFIYILMITLPFDINDWRVDKLTGVRTIPGVFGIRATKLMVAVLSVVYILGLSIFVWVLPWSGMQKVVFVGMVGILVLAMLLKTHRYSSEVSKWQIMLWYDGSFFWYAWMVWMTGKID